MISTTYSKRLFLACIDVLREQSFKTDCNYLGKKPDHDSQDQAMTDILRSRVALLCRMPSCRILSIAILLFLGITYYIIGPNVSTVHPIQIVDQNRDVSGEKYVTLLAPPHHIPGTKDKSMFISKQQRLWPINYYVIHIRKIHFNREFLVLATDSVKPKQISILQQLGAQVRVVQTLPPPSNVDPTRMVYRWKDQYTKLLLWNMTECTTDRLYRCRFVNY